jgi:hypothetical protein
VISRRVYPSRQRSKRFCLLLTAVAVASLAAGCGGGGGGSSESLGIYGQGVAGPGFSFQAPEDWTVKTLPTSAEARQSASTVVSVNVLPLVKPYRFALFPRVAKELDRVAAAYAANLEGTVRSRRTVDVAGRKARQYEISHGDLVDRITFVLRKKRNYQLTCRWRAQDGEPAACAKLVASFVFR